MPASVPTLYGDCSDQCGWYCPVLRPGGRPFFSLPGLFQKCRLLHGPATARNSSDPTLVYAWLIAVNSCGIIVTFMALLFGAAGSGTLCYFLGQCFQR